jgi:hypothetical protein
MQRLHFTAAAARRLNTLAGAVTNLATVTVIAVLVAVPAHAQKYPERPVRLISAYPPAGGVDITARIVGVELAKRLGHARRLTAIPFSSRPTRPSPSCRSSPTWATTRRKI